MIFHFSIPTKNPERVARVIAELWGGEAFPFFPHRNESWVAFAGDDRRSGVECYPYDATLAPSDEPNPTGFKILRGAAGPNPSATHGAIATELSEDDVLAIGRREGWMARYAQRGRFGVVELWLENTILFEVLPPDLQAQYVSTQSLDDWRLAVGAIEAQKAAASRPAAEAITP